MRTIKLMAAVIFLCMASFAVAQDNIIFKNGDELNAKVVEVGMGEIKYKKADNPNGPLYTIPKTTVLMIKYENGTKDVFTAPPFNAPKAQFDKHSMYPDKPMDYEAYRRLYKKTLAKGIVMTAIGAPMIIPGLALAVAGITSMNNEDRFGNGGRNDGQEGLIMAGVALLGAGIPLTVVGAVKIKAAKRIKNKANEVKASMSFNPIIAPSGFGQANNLRAGAGMRISF